MKGSRMTTETAERAYYLQVEKDLASLHRQAVDLLGKEQLMGASALSDALEAVCWHLGRAVLEAVCFREQRSVGHDVRA
jgi:hypothetical protein